MQNEDLTIVLISYDNILSFTVANFTEGELCFQSIKIPVMVIEYDEAHPVSCSTKQRSINDSKVLYLLLLAQILLSLPKLPSMIS